MFVTHAIHYMGRRVRKEKMGRKGRDGLFFMGCGGLLWLDGCCGEVDHGGEGVICRREVGGKVNRTVIVFLSIVIVALSIPLILRWVPPNGFYGFRVRRTLDDPTLWYAANAFAGWALLVSGVASGVFAMICPARLLSMPGLGGFVLVVPLIVAIVSSFIWLWIYG